jgi:hypothetical protein
MQIKTKINDIDLIKLSISILHESEEQTEERKKENFVITEL